MFVPHSDVDIKKISPKYILSVIDKWKNKGFYPNEVILKKKDILEKNFLKISKFIYDPIGDSSILPTFILCQKARTYF